MADSLIDHVCFFGGMVRISNYRLDGKNVDVIISNKRISTGKTKFGAVIGSNVRLGIGCIVYPGRLIGSNCRIDPKVNVINNLKNGQVVSVKQSITVTSPK